MRREYIIFIILLGILLSAGCAENGVEEPETAVTPAENPIVPAEVPQAPAEIVENPENNTSNQTAVENLTVPETEIVENPENNTSNQTAAENLTVPEIEIVENPKNNTSNQTAAENLTVPEAEHKTVEVKIEDFAFNPDSVTISPGDTVRWTNLDLFTHTVTGPDFSSGTLRDGDSYEFTFTREGTYRYYCSIHASMEGVVTVEGVKP
ncbi:TPA: cupredoxin family copper-binding protein [Methanosarcina acetivorans]|uniref:Cupredoxin family copper-binding protein n=1 Tax=Methanosarcina acetivorans TaxID=2214 RepID=A0A832W851_9EURY|nr:cupredoxin family copper-binding protein [Methanosarcina acetivorans]HIH93723.1 cupredoxin family copper-binding protein [Methanosarcina acetivorans]